MDDDRNIIKNMKKNNSLILAAVLGMALSAQSFAGSFTFESNLGNGVTIYTPTALGTVAGMYRLVSDTVPSVTYDIFCVDLGQTIGWNQVVTDFVPTDLANAPVGANNVPMGTVKAGVIDSLIYHYYSTVGGSSDNAANLQIAIWDVLAGYDVNPNGNPSSSSIITSMIQFATDNPVGTQYQALTSTSTQDFAVVPEPSTLALCSGLGLCGFVLLRRKIS